MKVERLGLIDYEECWRLQKEAQTSLIAGTGENILFVCQHPPVVTLGRSTKEADIREGRSVLAASGIPIYDIERGGSITYHGPEQVVVYPILNLTPLKRDVHWYMRQLEEVILQTLLHFDVVAARVEGKTGVWVRDSLESWAKIAFIGVRISRWCTMHGFSINVSKCADRYASFSPCGLGDISITSIEEVSKTAVTTSSVEDRVIHSFMGVFQFKSA